jgi:hypothetical protein
LTKKIGISVIQFFIGLLRWPLPICYGNGTEKNYTTRSVSELLTFPKHFDENEWFIIVIILLSLSLFKLPKRFPTGITILIIVFSMSLPKIIDHSIAADPYNLYDLNDSNKFELFDVLLDALYPPFGYLCVYLYDLLHPKGYKIVLYILSWTVIGVGFEYIAIQFNVFDHHGWKLIYSLPTYIATLSIYLLFYEFLTQFYKKTLVINN